ncbi:MAG: glycosyltransferase [Gammaproteobacteria bacterium]|jgi:hypothetical protein|nr:glycosyltransferase [Gammaproteobacteria bacterium]MBT4606953.1 glycosyltransferase [Thiotrichales bacterium]MBT3968672.1 glycosyltransferase [Gammaproteobacteria bacterium]MBT4080258.1 glycosyltransferase [Gammaproteobacteria bacterium]MBT4331474.1 glycosyltransferase [Gammaproteobacteria bacterium]
MPNQESPETTIPILYTHYGEEWIRGSERCLLDLITHLDRDHYTPIVWCNSHALETAVQQLGVTVVRSEFPLLLGWEKPRYNIQALLRLVQQGVNLVDRYNIQLLHANSGAPNQWLNLVARKRKLPLLAHLHARYPLRDRITLGLHQVSIAAGVSGPTIKQLQKDGLSSDRLRVIHNGIDSSKMDQATPIDLRKLLQIDADSLLLISVGSLIERKGMDLLLDVVHRLKQTGLPLKLAIVGSGPEQQRLQQRIQQLQLESSVFLLGERDDVPALLRGGADLFISAAREEVFGLVLAEAALAELPIIAPRVGGIPEVLDNSCALLVPTEDRQSLSNAIVKLYSDPARRREMGRTGRRRILDHFTIQHNVRAFHSLYQELLDNPKHRLHWHSHWSPLAALLPALRHLFRRVSRLSQPHLRSN